MKIDWKNAGQRWRQFRRWCLDHPPQAIMALMVFVAISSWINLWLFLFAFGCFVFGGISLFVMMICDLVQEDREQRHRWRQMEAQCQARHPLSEQLAARREGAFPSANTSPDRQTGGDQS